MSNMFYGCSNLEKLDLTSWSTLSVTTMANMFYGCNNLQEITLGEKFTFVGTNGYLPTPSSTYIDGADGNWYTIDGNIYASANIPNSIYAVYYASPIIVEDKIWNRDKHKYMHLASLRLYCDKYTEEVNIKLESLKTSMSEIDDITSEDIQALFS